VRLKTEGQPTYIAYRQTNQAVWVQQKSNSLWNYN